MPEEMVKRDEHPVAVQVQNAVKAGQIPVGHEPEATWAMANGISLAKLIDLAQRYGPMLWALLSELRSIFGAVPSVPTEFPSS